MTARSRAPEGVQLLEFDGTLRARLIGPHRGGRVRTQALMELEVAQHLGGERCQRSPDRQGGLQARRLSGDAA
jgi:hypothetical protein